MFLSPNVPENYRKWAFCCVEVKRYTCYHDRYAQGKPTGYFEALRVKMDKKWDSAAAFKKEAARLSRRIVHYSALRDKLAATLDDPEKYLLDTHDMINMLGHVINISPKRHAAPSYLLLTRCSPDGKTVCGSDDSRHFNALELLALGYGKLL